MAWCWGTLAGQARRSGSATVTISALADAWRTRDLLASILAGIATPWVAWLFF